TDTDHSSIAGTQSGITVNPAAATTLDVTNFPSPTTAGVSHNVTVSALDPYGNTDTGYTGTVTITSSDAHATLAGDYTFQAADHGTTGLAVTLKTAGTKSITATDGSDSSITGTQTGIEVDPAAVAGFGVDAPSTATAGTAFDVTVTARDAYGN